MQYWWVTANLYAEEHCWHWNRFFKDPSDDDNSVWGCGWIREATSLVHIGEMEKWDIVVAYQATECNILGLAYLRRGGFRRRRKEKDSFKLGWEKFVRLLTPVPLSEIQALNPRQADIEYVHKHMGSVFSLSSQGFGTIRNVMYRMNPNQAEEIRSFIAWAKGKQSEGDTQE